MDYTFFMEKLTESFQRVNWEKETVSDAHVCFYPLDTSWKTRRHWIFLEEETKQVRLLDSDAYVICYREEQEGKLFCESIFIIFGYEDELYSVGPQIELNHSPPKIKAFYEKIVMNPHVSFEVMDERYEKSNDFLNKTRPFYTLSHEWLLSKPEYRLLHVTGHLM